MSLPDAQTLKQQLDSALRKIREYEDAIVHQATVSRQSFYSLRTQHGVICPDCKQEAVHVCSSSRRIPEHEPSTACDKSSNVTTSSGKRNLQQADLECDPKRKRARQDSTEENGNTDQQSESQSSTRSVTSEDGGRTLDPENRAEWSTTYNTRVKKSLHVSLVRSFDTRPGCVNFSRDGQYLAVGFSHNVRMNIYCVPTGEEIYTLKDDSVNGKSGISFVRFSPDGVYVAAISSDNSVRVWEISEQHIGNVFKFSDGIFSLIDFSPDGRLLAFSDCECGTLYIYNLSDSSQNFLKDFKTGIYALRFSPDGQYIALGTLDGDILMLNALTGEIVERLVGHRNYVCSVAFTSDGTGLVSGSTDHTVKFWDIGFLSSKGKAKAGTALTFSGHKGAVSFVGVSSNSRWIVSFSDDGAMRIWDASNAELHCELHISQFDYFDYHPASGYLAVSSFDQVFLWRLEEDLD